MPGQVPSRDANGGAEMARGIDGWVSDAAPTLAGAHCIQACRETARAGREFRSRPPSPSARSSPSRGESWEHVAVR